MHEYTPRRRDSAPSLRAWLRRPAIMAPLGLLVLLLGVGVGVLVGFAHRSPQTTSGPLCPLPKQTLSWPTPPTQVVRYAPTNTPVLVTVQVSEALEVDLPTFWRLRSPSMYAPVLTLETPAGYTDASGTRCVWRFTAQHAGVVPLEFWASRGCPVPGASCAVAGFQVIVTVTEAKGGIARLQDQANVEASEETPSQDPLRWRSCLTMLHVWTDATRAFSRWCSIGAETTRLVPTDKENKLSVSTRGGLAFILYASR